MGSSAFILKKAVTATNAQTAEELCRRASDLLAAGSAAEAAEAFRVAIAAAEELEFSGETGGDLPSGAKAHREAIGEMRELKPPPPSGPGSAASRLAVDSALIEAHHGLVRALRDAGRLEQSVGAALALTVLTPGDPLAHTALSISLQHAGHVPEAEAAAARARVLEWKIQLQSEPEGAGTVKDEKP